MQTTQIQRVTSVGVSSSAAFLNTYARSSHCFRWLETVFSSKNPSSSRKYFSLRAFSHASLQWATIHNRHYGKRSKMSNQKKKKEERKKQNESSRTQNRNHIKEWSTNSRELHTSSFVVPMNASLMPAPTPNILLLLALAISPLPYNRLDLHPCQDP